MPLPTPRENEPESDFIGRCMADEVMHRDYPDGKQRSAVCYSQFRRKRGLFTEGDHHMAMTHNSKLADNEPDWGSVDKGKLPHNAFAEPGEADKKSTWGYPHHWVENGGDPDEMGCFTAGTMYLHRGGLAAARQRASQQGLGGEAMGHLNAHAKAIGMGEENQSVQNILRAVPDWLRANPASSAKETAVGVDRKAGIIRGVVAAETGVFRDRRGEFDGRALREIVRLMREEKMGLKSRFAHPTLSEDGLGKYLGRMRDPRRETILRSTKDGPQEVELVRADLYLDETALSEPIGGGKPLGAYVMDLAESDPEALGASLVIKADEEMRLDSKGRPLADESGEPLPPLWHPRELHALDVVDTGDATRSFLAIEELPDKIVRQAADLLNHQFAGQPRHVVRARGRAYLERYLDWRFGSEPEQEANPETWRKRFGCKD